MGNSAAVPFGIVLRDLVLEEGIVTGLGSPNWVAVADRLPGVHYETLRKAVAGERAPAPKLMETVASVFKVKPDVFYEYRLRQAQLDFDPKEVGVDKAIANLEAWADARAARKSR